ncbi:MAG: DNA-binding protein [Herpetosiphonaceae bacterium]|nr:MAG: DNA-binding protein [Herpetosiphonaceae bacterium]
MGDAESRNQLLDKVEQILWSSTSPLSKAEIARRCGVHRSTIGRLEEDLLRRGVPLNYDDEGRWSINRDAYVRPLHFNRAEALMLFLAGRLLARASDKPHPPLISALRRLATALAAIARPLGAQLSESTAILEEELPESPPLYQQVMSTLGQAWAEGRVVELLYQPLRAQRPFRHRFMPYFFEPSAMGYGTYVIGYADPPGKLRTRKIERILEVIVLDEEYSIPEDMHPLELLRGAWGIWFSEDESAVEVTLRFSSAVARRVRESRWHPTQSVEPDGEGGLIWRAQIDEPEELLPWVRSWGPDCEVLAPAELRERLRHQVERMANMYGVSGDKDDELSDDAKRALFGG